MRIHNWDVKLAIWASELTGKPFVWGETDCATLGRRAQEVIHGEDLWPEIRYDSKTAALRVLAEVGGIKEQLLSKGASQRPFAYAQSGDLLLLEAEDPLRSRCLVVVADRVLVTEEDSIVRTEPLVGSPGEVYRLE